MGGHSFLDAFYTDSCNEDARLESKHGRIEFITTMHYLEKYLFPGAKILEVGAATGRYAHTLARMDYEVEAVELVSHNIEVFQANTQPGERISVCQGDARDFDFTLVLGPMYHLYAQEDQRRALSEAVRVTKPGGILFVAYCISDASLIHFGFRDGHIKELLAAGMVDPVTFRTFSSPKDIFNLCRKEDIDALNEGFPLRRLCYVASDLAAHYIKDAIDAMDDETYRLYVRYHLACCERPDLVGVTNHSLDILRKDLQPDKKEEVLC